MENTDLLASQAAAVDAELQVATAPPEPTPDPNQPPPAPVPTPAQEAEGLVVFIVGILKPLYPSLDGIYTPDVCAKLGAAIAPVMAKYNFSVGAWFDKWKEEFNLVIVAGPILMQTLAAIKAENEARAAKEKAEKEKKEGDAPAPVAPAINLVAA